MHKLLRSAIVSEARESQVIDSPSRSNVSLVSSGQAAVGEAVGEDVGADVGEDSEVLKVNEDPPKVFIVTS